MWYSIKKKGFRMKEISIEDVLEKNHFHKLGLAACEKPFSDTL